MHVSLAQPWSSLKPSAPHMISTAPTGFHASGTREQAWIAHFNGASTPLRAHTPQPSRRIHCTRSPSEVISLVR